jgi:hypothetical protein
METMMTLNCSDRVTTRNKRKKEMTVTKKTFHRRAWKNSERTDKTLISMQHCYCWFHYFVVFLGSRLGGDKRVVLRCFNDYIILLPDGRRSSCFKFQLACSSELLCSARKKTDCGI